MENKKYEVKFSPSALRQIEEIEVYISEELLNPVASLELVEAIYGVVDRLEMFPFSAPFFRL